MLAPLFGRYIDDVRPWFLSRRGASHALLWVQDDGQPYRVDALRLRVAAVTQDVLGVRVPPHFFRDAAATTLARTSPDAARLIRTLLGHADYGTAERHYVHAQGIESGRDDASLVARLKQEAEQ